MERTGRILMITPTPLDPLLDNCMRTLMVSKGWQVQASIKPAEPPATKWVIRVLGFVSPALLMMEKNEEEEEG